ncbi:PAS domain-containing sensor histidine kinase [Telluribacter humicola]|uniref:PAS domain-containing sensor histidine kinase n=1 Tax=Telluribacter humicola TaxID=1720261 RepID=UPI001A975BD8|nr:ATP-binding protein [Telluribacter humicola]
MHNIVLEYFDNASDALLICQFPKDDDGREFEVQAINKQAKSILSWTSPISAPVPIQKVIPSMVLLNSIDRAYTSGVKQLGIIEPSPLAGRDASFSYEVNKLDNTVLVQLRKKEPAKPFTQALGEHLLNTSLTCVVAFEAVRNEAGQIEDLRLVFQNAAAEANPFLGIQPRLGTFITEWYPSTKQMGQFARYVEVIETGQPFVSEKHYPDKDQTFHVAVSKYNDGVIISYYNLTDKQVAERKAKQQASILQQIIDSSQDAIALWDPLYDPDGKIIDFKAAQYNKATLYSGMFTDEDYQQLTLTQLSPGACEYISQYAQVLETGEPVRIERNNRRDGLELWMDISASKLGDQMLTILKDITIHKKNTQELEAYNQLLDGILDSSDNFILVTEALRDGSGQIDDFRITKANRATITAFEQMFSINAVGLTIKQLVGNNPELLKDALSVMESGVPLKMDNWYDPISHKWMKVSMQKLNNGIVTTYVDISDIQKALLEAQEQKELVEGVLDSSINGIFAMEPIQDDQGALVDFRIVMTNQAGVRFSDNPHNNIVGNTYLSLFPIVEQTGVFNRFVEAIDKKEPYRAEVRFPSPNGKKEFWYDLSLIQMKNGLIILTFMDISDRVVLSQKQEALLEELRQSNRSLEQFAYIASHDLYEPTRKINAFGDMLVKQYAQVLPPAGLDLIRRMQSSSVRMQDLIDGLLMYSRFSTQNEAQEIVPRNTILNNILLDLETTIEEKKATIQVGTLPRIRGNAVQLRQLFQNLISNALKFTDDSTTPQVIVESGPASQEEVQEAVQLPSNKNWCAIRVRDNGIGFDEEHRTKVFELFARLHGRSQYPGSGLGLAICKKVAEQHGGGITVTSTPGEGSTFVVVLPELT